MTTQKIKLLFVASDNLHRTSFERFVKDEGLPYRYTLAGRASEAEEKLTSDHFDIVLLDVSPADETGFNVFKLIDVAPVVAITTVDNEEIAVKATPLPERRIIGNIADINNVSAALGIL